MSFKYFTFLRFESRFKLEISYNLINFSLFLLVRFARFKCTKRFVLSKPTLTVLPVAIPIVIAPSPIPVAIPRPRSPSIVPAAIIIPLPSIPVRAVPIRPRSPTILVAIVPRRRPPRRRRFPPVAVAGVFGALRWRRRRRTPTGFPVIVPAGRGRPRPFVSASTSFAVPLVGVGSLGKRDVILSRKLLQLLLDLLLNRDGNARKECREPVQLGQELAAHQPDRDALQEAKNKGSNATP